jgi:hypothetical protein
MENLPRVLRVLVLALGLVAAPALASAQTPAAPAADPSAFQSPAFHKYKINPEKDDIPLTKGRQFLADLAAADPELKASVTEAVRFEIQNEETEKFARQKGYVLWAYGALWVVLLVFVVGLLLRQRQLAAELASLEARVKVEKA